MTEIIQPGFAARPTSHELAGEHNSGKHLGAYEETKREKRMGFKKLGIYLWLLIAVHGGLFSCVSTEKTTTEGEFDKLPIQTLPSPDLAGVWQYEGDNVVVYMLTLDHQGNGTYDWQGGLFETISLSNGKWRGIWRQNGNDRECGFEAQLSPDFTSATGWWWYTRIGDNKDPLLPGGNFSFSRPSNQ